MEYSIKIRSTTVFYFAVETLARGTRKKTTLLRLPVKLYVSRVQRNRCGSHGLQYRYLSENGAHRFW
jgi:hypothetical protein